MTKQEFLTTVQNKAGFHSIIKDELAPDNVPNDPIEKRYLYVNHTNSDGTMGKTYVYYLYDEANDNAAFYNVEPEAVDMKAISSNQEKLDALQNYLATNFDAFFVIRYDFTNNWAEADTYKYNTTSKLLDKKTVIVYKKGSNPIAHLVVA